MKPSILQILMYNVFIQISKNQNPAKQNQEEKKKKNMIKWD